MSWMPITKPSRIVIEDIVPSVPWGEFFVKRTVGEPINVRAAIFADGHQEISADLLWREISSKNWNRTPMKHLGNDVWEGDFTGAKVADYEYTVAGWINEYKTWQHDLAKRKEAGQELSVEYEIGKRMIREALNNAN